MAKNRIVKNPSPLSRIQLKSLVLPAALIIIFIILGLVKNQFVAAQVNGEQINRLELIRELEKREGKRALENLISQKLILQEAEKKKVKASEEDINREIAVIEKNIKDQGQNLDDLLSLQGLTRQQLKDEVKIQLLLKRLVGKVEVTDKEVSDYIEKNKASLRTDLKNEEIKKQAKTQLEQDKINQKIQTLVQELRKNAKIEYILKI